MRLVVAGSRSINDYYKIARVLDNVLAQTIGEGRTVEELVEGEARGVDRLARRWAEERGIPVKPFPAEWDKIEGVSKSRIRTYSDGKMYNSAAGYERNRRMIKYAGSDDLLVAFWDGKSNGTGDCIKQAQEKNLRSIIVRE